MLILSRKNQESLIIESPAGKIEIMVSEISSGQVRLGIKAPESCKIWRKELCQTIEYNQMATEGETSSSTLRRLSQSLGPELKKAGD